MLSIKGRLTLKEVAVLDVANLSAIIQDTYLLWNSMRPIDMHTAFNRAEWTGHMSPVKALSTDGAHVAQLKQLKTGVVLHGVCVCVCLVDW